MENGNSLTKETTNTYQPLLARCYFYFHPHCPPTPPLQSLWDRSPDSRLNLLPYWSRFRDARIRTRVVDRRGRRAMSTTWSRPVHIFAIIIPFEDVVDIGTGGGRARLRRTIKTYKRSEGQRHKACQRWRRQRHGEGDECVLWRRWGSGGCCAWEAVEGVN